MLCGTGAHGAYHAGVLRALQEAGVKIDLVAGHGMGAATAALAAIDGGARLWESDGIWWSPRVRTLYSWNPLLRAGGWMAVLLVAVLLIPIAALAAASLAHAAGFLLTIVGLDAGSRLTTAVSQWLAEMFAPTSLPTLVPRLAVVVLALFALLSGAAALRTWQKAPARRRTSGGWWWQALGAPIEASASRAIFSDAIWQLIRGAAAPALPNAAVMGRRYAEVLGESIGQPGFKELITIATDLDARQDLVMALVREPYHLEFFAPREGRDRRAEVLDLGSSGAVHMLDMIGAALTPPLACEPSLITFPVDTVWRGETHRVCDRPGATERLLEEVAAAGVSQVIVVSASSPVPEPHRLTAPRLELRHRLGEFLTTSECAALRDAMEMARLRFDAVYTIRPSHIAVGPFDLRGAYDAASDRQQDLPELMARAYEDAYRQFIEPVVGASGEQMAQPRNDEMRLSF